jgi:acetate kinase
LRGLIIGGDGVNILAVNCGSTSLKWKLFAGDGVAMAAGTVEGVGGRGTSHASIGSSTSSTPVVIPDHGAAAALVADGLASAGLAANVHGIGHRVVHGGDLATPAVVDGVVLAAIEQSSRWAPMHNSAALASIRVLAERFPGVVSVATFDTAFHRSMPETASRYAIDVEMADRHGVRRYGFHGLAHRSMAERYATVTGRQFDQLRLVTLQLGSGCSAAAIADGRSVETSMGLTPLEGLMMATRSGDVDPTLPGVLARAEGVDVAVIEELLASRSGLLGVSGRSSDMRVLLAAADDDRRSALAVEMFCHRARKYVGAYMAVLGGADAVVFGGGVGEHSPEVRRRVCEGMAWCGLVVDEARNGHAQGGDARVAADGSPVDVWTIAVDEEAVIAADTRAVLDGAP